MAIVLASRKEVLVEPSEILEPSAREVPNSLLSRKEWFEHVLMFPRDDPKFHDPALSGARAMQARRAIMDACDRMRDAEGPDQLTELWAEVAEQEAILDEELERDS